MGKRIRVLIADDLSFIRSGFRKLLSLSEDIDVIGEATTAHQAADLAVALHPDVVLMDLKWQKDPTAGNSGIRLIKQQAPNVRVLAMTAYPELIESARLAGADMAVDKDVLDNYERLSDFIQQVAHMNAFPVPVVYEADLPTEREREILQMIADGDSDEAIALKIKLSVGAAKRQISDLYNKIDARNRANAISIAYSRGWLSRHP